MWNAACQTDDGGQGWLSLLYGVLVLVPFVPLAVRRMRGEIR